MEQLPQQPDKFMEEEESVPENSRKSSRSSILKRKSINQTLGNDSSEDVTTVKEAKEPKRRVSFASIKSIKPFATDPEKNTIWDNSYREQEADLTPPKSADPILVLETTLSNITEKESMELTCISQKSEINTVINKKIDTSNTSMQLTCVLPPHPELKTHMELRNQFDQSLVGVLPTYDQSINASSMQLTSMVCDQTEVEVTNMQLTCVLPAQSEEYFDQNADASTMQFTCVLQNHPDQRSIKTVDQNMESSMQLTCVYSGGSTIKSHVHQQVKAGNTSSKQLPKGTTYTMADKENVFPNFQPNSEDFNCLLPTQSGIKSLVEQNMENSMQLTRVFPRQPIRCHVDQQVKANLLPGTITSSKQLPKETTYIGVATVDAVADKENVPNSQPNLQLMHNSNMEFSCLSTTQSGIETPVEQNMENSMQLTCVFPTKISIKGHVDQRVKAAMPNNSLKQLPEEITYTVADKEKVFPNSEDMDVNMQLTCLLPTQSGIETPVEQNMENSMHLTCVFPKTSRDQQFKDAMPNNSLKQLPEETTYTVADKENVFPNSQIPNTEDMDVNMQLTCLLPTQSGIKTPVEQNMENSMQLTCAFPKITRIGHVDRQVKAAMPNNSLKQLPEEITYTVADKENVFPNSQIPNTEDMDVNMQLTCLLPTQSGIKTPVEQNMENSMQLTCAFPKITRIGHVDRQVKAAMPNNSLKQLPQEITYTVADKENAFPNFQPMHSSEMEVSEDMELTSNLTDFLPLTKVNVVPKPCLAEKNDLTYVKNISKLESNEKLQKSLVDIINEKTKVSPDVDVVVKKVVKTKTVIETTSVSKIVIDKESEKDENASKRTTRATTKDAKIKNQKIKDLPLTKVEKLKQVPQENIVSKPCTRATSKAKILKDDKNSVELKKDAEILLEKSSASKKVSQPEALTSQFLENMIISKSIPKKDTPSKITDSLKNQIQTNEDVAIKITEAENDDRCPENGIDFFSQSENVLTKSKNEKLLSDLGMTITPGSSFAIISRSPVKEEKKIDESTLFIEKQGCAGDALLDMELAPQLASSSMEDSQEASQLASSPMDVSLEEIPPLFGDKFAPIPEIVEEEKSTYPMRFKKAMENFNNIATINAKPNISPRPFPLDLLKRNEEADKIIKALLENFKLPEIEIVDFEELDKMEKEYGEGSETLGSGLSDGLSEGNSGTGASIEAPKTLEERVRENITRTPKLIALAEIIEEDCFCFFTFYKAVPFQAYVDVSSGAVEKIEAFTSLMKVTPPDWKYQATCLQEKLKMERCISQLGKGFDLITFLDYVYMSAEETINFQNEFNELENTYGKSHRFRMDSDFCIIIELINIELLIWWIITLEMSMEHIGRIKSIRSHPRAGYEDDPPPEKEIEKILANTPGPNVLENLTKNLDEFVKHNGPKILAARDGRYRNRIRLLKCM